MGQCISPLVVHQNHPRNCKEITATSFVSRFDVWLGLTMLVPSLGWDTLECWAGIMQWGCRVVSAEWEGSGVLAKTECMIFPSPRPLPLYLVNLPYSSVHLVSGPKPSPQFRLLLFCSSQTKFYSFHLCGVSPCLSFLLFQSFAVIIVQALITFDSI